MKVALHYADFDFDCSEFVSFTYCYSLLKESHELCFFGSSDAAAYLQANKYDFVQYNIVPGDVVGELVRFWIATNFESPFLVLDTRVLIRNRVFKPLELTGICVFYQFSNPANCHFIDIGTSVGSNPGPANSYYSLSLIGGNNSDIWKLFYSFLKGYKELKFDEHSISKFFSVFISLYDIRPIVLFNEPKRLPNVKANDYLVSLLNSYDVLEIPDHISSTLEFEIAIRRIVGFKFFGGNFSGPALHHFDLSLKIFFEYIGFEEDSINFASVDEFFPNFHFISLDPVTDDFISFAKQLVRVLKDISFNFIQNQFLDFDSFFLEDREVSLSGASSFLFSNWDWVVDVSSMSGLRLKYLYNVKVNKAAFHYVIVFDSSIGTVGVRKIDFFVRFLLGLFEEQISLDAVFDEFVGAVKSEYGDVDFDLSSFFRKTVYEYYLNGVLILPN